MTEREKKLEDILAQFLKPLKGIPFEVAIKSICEKEVLQFDRSQKMIADTLDLIINAMRLAGKEARDKKIIRPRPNEVGNDMEAFVVRGLSSVGLDAAVPKAFSGKGKSTGYPDVRVKTPAGVVYIEVKTYAADNKDTSFRSFYLSPTDDPKVHEDGFHLLVGFETLDGGVTGKKDSARRDLRAYEPVGFVIVDLYGLECDVKFEFNSDNRRLYETSRLLCKEKLGQAGTDGHNSLPLP